MARDDCTHTFVTLAVSKATYDEIAAKLQHAGWDHAFVEIDGTRLIDVHGIALECEEQ